MDDAYIDKILNGETEAFRYFIQNYKDMAFSLAVSIVRDDQYAEEIVQDAFIKAFNGLKSFRRTATFKSWFYRIVINESFQRLGKMKKDLKSVDITQVEGELWTEPLNDGEEINKIDQVRAAMKLLPQKESLALNLFYLSENSLAEIVELTGWSLSNAKVILHRARRHIRQLLTID